MFSLLIAAEILAWVAMVAVSLWGWRRLPPEARVRARAGATGLDWTMSKNTTLVSTPITGLLVLLGTASLNDSANRDAVAALGFAVMLIFLMAHWSSVKRAAL